ncbi:MAG TPA: phosphonate ABC transporter ATP-binding protein [Pseudohongiella sp.]|nr:phosphonate ABC transporter ATP-binding protein [Pseudohongiella sp.]HBX36742.1 phosphonate ABC transporter ATP-binding protein [Pseudohongiella sp.]|tara:strand:- start:1759 stop:2454 length:696 start_codon:yes stop_codon:yes gene_type:complete
MIKLDKICKVHRTDEIETAALDDINLTVQKGEFLSIMGPSGCGKSTLLNVLGLLDTPSSGHYFFDGEDLAGYNESQRASIRKANIGVIFQSFNLIDELTVAQNVDLALLYQKIPANERKTKVEAVLKRVAIDHRSKHYPQQLSGGQQQRVAIARAIVTSPKVLLADEPTGNLDTRNGDDVMALLKELNHDGATVIMVTHSEHYAAYGSRVIRLLDGQVVDANAKADADAVL